MYSHLSNHNKRNTVLSVKRELRRELERDIDRGILSIQSNFLPATLSEFRFSGIPP